MVRILLAADSPLDRHGMASAFAGSPEFEVVGEAAAVDEVAGMVAHHKPDVLLLLLEVLDAHAQERLRRLASVSPESRVIVLAEHDDGDGLMAAMSAGAQGYGLRLHTWPDDLRAAVRALARGYCWICPAATQRLLADVNRLQVLKTNATDGLLTDREVEVLRLVAEGLTSDEIGRILIVSRNTVKTHVRRTMGKLDARTRHEAVAKAVTRGILPNRRRQSDARCGTERDDLSLSTADSKPCAAFSH